MRTEVSSRSSGREHIALRVFKLTQEYSDWIADRTGDFLSYKTGTLASRKPMGQLFNMACSAAAATNVIADDKSTHQVTAVVPSLMSFPLRLRIHLTGMSSESGWEALRPADGRRFCDREPHHGQFSFERRSIDVKFHTIIECHRSVMRAIERGRRAGDQLAVDVCVKLVRLPTGTDPVYGILLNS